MIKKIITTKDKLIKNYFGQNILVLLIFLFHSNNLLSEEFSVKFKDTDIKEFINTVSKNINKTIIMDPKVKGLISVRSYENLDKKKYYQFFLHVLDVHGYTVSEMPNNILKIIPVNLYQASNSVLEVHKLVYASATEVIRIINELLAPTSNNKPTIPMTFKIIADERTNSILISGDINSRKKVSLMIKYLDKKRVTSGKTKVIYLKYAKADQLLNVLNGMNSNIKKSMKNTKIILPEEKIMLKADTQTNALIITSPPDVMHDLEQVIEKLDIRRAQVLVEAIIVESHDNTGLNLGIRWSNTSGGGVNFIKTASHKHSMVLTD
ncbi:secretin N-terminal domain-containing protein [Candidatus Fukatsuia endosymbiont of Tuberolachnus salignus]|uniref:secretin N-terminal domain-containing protein n=1 Tax=Candidatus Fukatsuia endosymbiont of Tuberolachnus salignus TaxID=3077957 RepID=UPI003CC7A0E4